MQAFGEELTQNPQHITGFLASPEKMGDIGFHDPIVEDPNDERATDVVEEFGELFTTSAETAEEYDELVDSIFDHSLTTPPLEENFTLSSLCDEPNMADYLFRSTICFLEYIDQIAETENELMFMNLVNDLEIQGCLDKSACLCLYTLHKKQDALRKYAHTFNTESLELIEKLNVCKEEPTDSNWRQLLRQASPVLETALPPIVALVEYLKTDSHSFENVWSYDFSTQVQKISDFEPLEDIIDHPKDYALRNAVSHGGISGLRYHKPNKQWKVETKKNSYELSKKEFQERASRFAAASIGFHILPIYLISAAVTVEMLRSH